MNGLLKVLIRYVVLVAFFSIFIILREKELDLTAAIVISLLVLSLILIFDLVALLINMKFNKFYNKYVYILAMGLVIALDIFFLCSFNSGEADAGFALIIAFVAPIYIFPSALVAMILIGIFDKKGKLHG